MSALSSICDYSSYSDESDSEIQEIVTKRPRLTVPDLSLVSVVTKDDHVDLPHLHDDKIRSFPHVRGNWPTFVYTKYSEENFQILEVVNKLKTILCSKIAGWQICDDFHISLSRTVVLKYHWITTFNTSLQKALKNFARFDLNFNSVNVYCNEENSRTFISFEVDVLSQEYLTAISKTIDTLLDDFKLPTFYKKPSFHMSVLWINGDKKSVLNGVLSELNHVLIQEYNNNTLTTLRVENVYCKCGNKFFQYSLL